MKRYAFIAMLTGLSFFFVLTACNKNTVPLITNEIIETDTVLYRGVLSGGEMGDFAKGNVSIEKLSGKDYLVFKNFSSSNGPAVHIYLSTTIGSHSNPATNYIDLGLLKATSGTFNYELTTKPNIETFKYAMVWCEKYHVQFGVALLTK